MDRAASLEDEERDTFPLPESCGDTAGRQPSASQAESSLEPDCTDALSSDPPSLELEAIDVGCLSPRLPNRSVVFCYDSPGRLRAEVNPTTAQLSAGQWAQLCQLRALPPRPSF